MQLLTISWQLSRKFYENWRLSNFQCWLRNALFGKNWSHKNWKKIKTSHIIIFRFLSSTYNVLKLQVSWALTTLRAPRLPFRPWTDSKSEWSVSRCSSRGQRTPAGRTNRGNLFWRKKNFSNFPILSLKKLKFIFPFFQFSGNY